MISHRFHYLALVGILAGLFLLSTSQVNALQSLQIGQGSPAACPSTGCAAGQRINFYVNYNVAQFDTTIDQPNLQVCVYTPIKWGINSFFISPKGGVTGIPYDSSQTTMCTPPPTDSELAGGALAKLTAGVTKDSLPFLFRIGPGATANGLIVVRVLARDASSAWTMIGQGDFDLSVTATADEVYVANDADTCSTNEPCYVNSQNDGAGGIGTGLKDAIDAAPATATINILGVYLIKQNSISISQPQTITSSTTGRISYAGVDCSQPMLAVTSGATLSGLAIDDGNCASPNRDLVQVNSPDPVVIESSDLIGGKDAIRVVSANSASVTVRYNQIVGNSGFAVWMDAANTGLLDAFANNLYNNRTGVQVECGAADRGNANHNYFGPGVSVAQAVSHCSASDSKRLGAAILRNTSTPGVQAQTVTVGANSQYFFNDSIGVKRTNTTTDFNVVLVNHGSSSTENVPFTAGQWDSPYACSNFFDVFLPDPALPADPATLELFLKYNLTYACKSTVESAQFCGQSGHPEWYPLRWYDPASGTWKTTGSSGQVTQCNMSADEIQVSIKSGNRPDFNDLSRLPFVIGLPFLTNLQAQPKDNQVIVVWSTSSNANLTGFYVQRSDQPNTGFLPLSGLISSGSATTGSSYSFTDSNVTNGSVYYYRLQIVRSDGTYLYSDVVSAKPAPPTATPTPTRSYTPTPSNTPKTPTPSRTRTLYPTSTFIYHSPTPTATYTRTPTSPFKTITSAPSPTPSPSPTRLLPIPTGAASPRVTNPAYPAVPTLTLAPATVLAVTRQVRTEVAQLSATPTPTPQSTGSGRAGPLTVVMAIVAFGALAGGFIFLMRERRQNP